jgi:hypothetical protein
MKKYIYSVVAFAVFAASAFAYTGVDRTVSVNVPFAFQAGSSTLPAGTYTITEPINGFVLIRSAKGGIFLPKAAVLIDSDDSGKSTLRFARSGGTYVLRTDHPLK